MSLTLTALLLSLAVSLFGIDCSIREFWFERDLLCDLDQRLFLECSKKISTHPMNMMYCASLCHENQCRGVSINEYGNCFLHWECPNAETSCIVQNANHNFMKIVTPPSSEQEKTTEPPITVGSCRDLQDLEYSYDDHRVYLKPDIEGSDRFLLLCKGWHHVIFMRNSGDGGFNRTWLEYTNGFHINEYNLWGGLDAFRALSNAGYIVTIVIHLNDGEFLTTHYDFVTVGREAESYWLATSTPYNGGSEGSINSGFYLGDCFGHVYSAKFSTWDRDNTNGGLNCAAKAGSGWWFKDNDCTNPCNILGLGNGYWFSKPAEQLFSLPTLDMKSLSSSTSYTEMLMTLR